MARILLAEDDDAVRTFVSRALQMDGHDVEEAPNGMEALELLHDEGGRFEMLLSDIKMPGIDGIQLAHACALDYPEITILLMTGYADQRERADGLMAIVEDVLSKPFTLTQIRTSVATALQAKAA